MKINISKHPDSNQIYSCEITTEEGHKLDQVREIDFHAGVGEVSRARITLNQMDDATFELLDASTEVIIKSDYLFSFPTYEIIKHLKEMGYEVTPK